MEIFGYIAALLIGLSLGLTGSGGSILTVPISGISHAPEPGNFNGLFTFCGGHHQFSRQL